MERNDRRHDFLFGAILLSGSSFLVKLIGAIFRIPLTNLVGAPAMGYYSSAYSVYIVLLSLATSGMPTGIAVMVSRALALKKYSNIKRTVRIAGFVFIPIGFVLSVLGMIFARPIAMLMNSENAYYAMLFLMPAVFFISVVALFKGFFQGYNNMAPTATSNLIEAIVKLGAGYSIAYYLHSQGYCAEIVVGGAIAGITLSTLCAMLFMVFRYMFRGKKYRPTKEQLSAQTATPTAAMTKEFFALTLPIMVSAITSNLMGAVDAFLVVNCLKQYIADITRVNLLWGSFGNMAVTVFNLPSFLIVSIGTALIPGIAALFAKKELTPFKHNVDKALKYTSIISFACAFGINVTAGQILRLMFHDPESIAIATGLLQIISFVLISVGYTNITSSILSAVKKAHLTIISVAAGAVTKSLFTFIFVSIPALNIYGAPMATNIAYPLMAFINFYFIKKYVGILPNFKDILFKPLLAGGILWVTAKLLNTTFIALFGDRNFIVFITVVLTAVVYVGVLLLLKLVSVSELKSMLKRKKRS